jgi:hypothetical protein
MVGAMHGDGRGRLKAGTLAKRLRRVKANFVDAGHVRRRQFVIRLIWPICFDDRGDRLG